MAIRRQSHWEHWRSGSSAVRVWKWWSNQTTSENHTIAGTSGCVAEKNMTKPQEHRTKDKIWSTRGSGCERWSARCQGVCNYNSILLLTGHDITNSVTRLPLQDQKYRANESVLQESPLKCPARVSHKSVARECPTRVFCKSVPPEHRTQECLTRVSLRSVKKSLAVCFRVHVCIRVRGSHFCDCKVSARIHGLQAVHQDSMGALATVEMDYRW